ncbi:phosphate/phosphite/phosphonate ABC transporter substrate-binding protein [Halosimplex halophilum]|uniref:phosphate/phosphite/phosphonate ABC transporter substrate-binding protein n=1 Tax=Halosimplex halophilum TaxID=2559572 RepID=UPI00107F17CD|nr:phosphate/phosphite/phosphonate ABC transporter substrate-binding protein [Halosimplex halophilum]
MRDRRTFLKGMGVLAGAGSLAGCTSGSSTDTPGGGGSTDASDGGSTATEAAGDTLSFGGDREVNMGLSPSVPQQNLYVQYGPIRDYLETHLDEEYDVPQGLSVDMNIGTNYSTVIQALGEGTADIAETGPFAAALGVNTDNAEVILQRKGYGSWTYKSIIAVPNDSDIESLSDLSGKTVAFSDQLSTSGCLYPLYSISSEGDLDVGELPEGNGSQAEFEARFAGGHVQSYTLLNEGRADAAAMGAFVRDTKTGPTPDEFENTARTLHEDSGLPRAPIVVSPELSDDAKEALRQSFLNAPDRIYYGADGEDGTDDDLWFSAVREADVDTYQSVIDVADELGVGPDIFE